MKIPPVSHVLRGLAEVAKLALELVARGRVVPVLEFLNPGLLGTASDFRRRFAVPVERIQEALAEAYRIFTVAAARHALGDAGE
jgi:hypothetical protein